MRQQQYEQALKEVRAALQEGQSMSMLNLYSGIAIDIIDKVLKKVNDERGASIRRDVANNYSGQ